MEEGILPTTNEISVLKFAEDGDSVMEENADGFFVRIPASCVVQHLQMGVILCSESA